MEVARAVLRGHVAAMQVRLLLLGPGRGRTVQHSRCNITQHVSKLKLELMRVRWDVAAMQWDAIPCDAMRWSLKCQTDDAQAHTHSFPSNADMGTNTSKHGAPVTAGYASVVGAHTGR